nr:SIS domain-containing protein [Candidatus Solirubrobacter pratensis]
MTRFASRPPFPRDGAASVAAPPAARGFTARDHVDALSSALADLDVARLERWGVRLAAVLGGGGRLLALGNGGSAAQAQHLTAELVGRYRDDRPPFSALALCSEGPALTAIGNDYGAEQVFARQVAGHGRPGDVVIALSTSGASPNVIAAAEVAREGGMTVLGLTGPSPNPLFDRCDDALCVDSPHTPTIQEIHLIAIHLLCAAFDAAVMKAVLPR